MNAAEPTRQAALLDRAAVHVRAAQLNAAQAQVIVRRDPLQGAQFACDAKEAASRALAVLCGDLGATMPPIQAGDAAPVQSGGLDLNALAMLDTPSARAVLDLLTQAQAAAELLDKERGHVLPSHIPTGPNESRGTNYAEDISNLAARLRGEIFGGAGRD